MICLFQSNQTIIPFISGPLSFVSPGPAPSSSRHGDDTAARTSSPIPAEGSRDSPSKVADLPVNGPPRTLREEPGPPQGTRMAPPRLVLSQSPASLRPLPLEIGMPVNLPTPRGFPPVSWLLLLWFSLQHKRQPLPLMCPFCFNRSSLLRPRVLSDPGCGVWTCWNIRVEGGGVDR